MNTDQYINNPSVLQEQAKSFSFVAGIEQVDATFEGDEFVRYSYIGDVKTEATPERFSITHDPNTRVHIFFAEKLTYIDVKSNLITDVDISHLSDQLTYLNLFNNQLASFDASALPTSCNNLIVGANGFVNDAQAEFDFYNSLPDVSGSGTTHRIGFSRGDSPILWVEYPTKGWTPYYYD